MDMKTYCFTGFTHETEFLFCPNRLKICSHIFSVSLRGIILTWGHQFLCLRNNEFCSSVRPPFRVLAF
jgi:hypothetical protein